MLLLGKYSGFGKYRNARHPKMDCFLCLSIHEICSDNRVGPALWSFESSVDDDFNASDFEVIKSTQNPLTITFRMWFGNYWKLFEISTTTETNASDNLTLIESGRIDFDSKIKGREWEHQNTLGLFEIFMQC